MNKHVATRGITAAAVALIMLPGIALAEVGDVVCVNPPQCSLAPPGASFCAIGVAFDGASLYVNRCGEDSVYRIDPTNGSVLAEFDLSSAIPDPVLERPAGMAYHDDHRPQRARSRRGEVLCGEHGGGLGHREAHVVIACCVFRFSDRALFPSGQGRTRDGPFRGSRLAVDSPAHVCDPIESSVLFADASGAQRKKRPNTRNSRWNRFATPLRCAWRRCACPSGPGQFFTVRRRIGSPTTSGETD